MRHIPRIGFALLLASSFAAGQDGTGPTNLKTFLTTDRFVAHESTVPINAGERVGLFVREKLTQGTTREIANGSVLNGRVVLFIHGVSVPSVPVFDLDYGDYSWMRYLAAAGFDTFAMDQTGYGRSPRPAMDNPCNLDASDRRVLDAAVIPDDCAADYESRLTSSQTDWDEIDTVVDTIRGLRGVMRVPNASYWGFNAESAPRIRAPTLIVVGLQDGLLRGAEALYADLSGASDKVLVRMDCATHFAVWEASQHAFLQEASRQWLSDGRYRGRSSAEYRVDFGGLEPE